jgi:hypothetical protein
LFQLAHSEQNQNELQATRLALEKEITVKKNSIIIDRERCLRSGNIKTNYNQNGEPILSPPSLVQYEEISGTIFCPSIEKTKKCPSKSMHF